MTRLHEQLHKETTPDEQALTLTMLSDEAKQRLIGLLKISPVLGTRNVWVCEPGQRHCIVKHQKAFRTSKPKCWGCEYFSRPEKESCWVKECYAKKYSYTETESHLKHDIPCEEEYCRLNPTYAGPTSGQLEIGDSQYEWHQELEKLCTHGKFIIGYIDIYYILQQTVQTNLQISPNWTWPDFEEIANYQKVIVECKPEIKTFQGVLRQIKTYMDVFPGSMGVIATYSELPSSVLELLLKENVHVLRFPKPVLETPAKRNGLDKYPEMAEGATP